MILASHWIENLSDETQAIDQDKKDTISRIVDELPEEYRLIVEAIVYERLTYRDAADRLGYKAHSQVYYKFEEALELLRQELEDWFEDHSTTD